MTEQEEYAAGLRALQKLVEAHERIQQNPAKARECGHVYELCFTDSNSGSWLVNLKDNPGVWHKRPDESAECTIIMSAEDFMRMAAGEITGALLFYSGKLKVSGDQALLMKLGVLEELLK